jgi:hypothetical protein
MRTPGFTATASLSQTPRGGGVDRTRRTLLDAEPEVLPAQIDWSRLLSALRGGQRWLWEGRPACPPGEKAVWVSRGPTEKCCETQARVWDHYLMRYIWVTRHVCDWQVCGGWEPAFEGWECQPALRVVA